VTLTPGSANITTAQTVTVTVAVSAGNGNPTPTGSIILSAGSYNSFPTTLSNGSATIYIPNGILPAGTDKLSAVYTPDSLSSIVYIGATGTVSVTVTQAVTATPTFSVPAGRFPSAQTVAIYDATPGATIYYAIYVAGAAPGHPTQYTGPITVSSSETLGAIAIAYGYSESADALATYTISPAAVTRSVTGSSFPAQEVGATTH
jgi:hypothetical protein